MTQNTERQTENQKHINSKISFENNLTQDKVVTQFKKVTLVFIAFSLRKKGDVPTEDVETEGLSLSRTVECSFS